MPCRDGSDLDSDAVPQRRILLVAPLSPPSTLSAAHRVGGMTRHLARLGHEVTVLTSVLSGHGDVPGAARTIRTRDLMVSRLNWRRKNFEAIASSSGESYDPRASILTRIIVPDIELVSWIPFALRRALALRNEVDCVITSSPPNSCHLIGLALHRAGVPWVADFRDGWGFEPLRPEFPTKLQRMIDSRLESLVAHSADSVVAVTDPISQDLAKRFGISAATITNGFDPEHEVGEEGWEPPLDPDRHSLVYTGSLSYSGNRSVQPLLTSLDLIKHNNADIAKKLEIVFAGPTTAVEQSAMAKHSDIVRTLGRLSHRKTLGLQAAADSLLVLAGNQNSGIATGKLYEYLRARRPILVLGTNTAAAKIVEKTETGMVVSADDSVDISSALLRLVDSPTSPETVIGNAPVNEFGYPFLAEQMSNQVELAIKTAGSE